MTNELSKQIIVYEVYSIRTYKLFWYSKKIIEKELCQESTLKEIIYQTVADLNKLYTSKSKRDLKTNGVYYYKVDYIIERKIYKPKYPSRILKLLLDEQRMLFGDSELEEILETF